MLIFREIELKDKKAHNKILNNSDILNSEYVFANWIMWSRPFGTTFCIKDKWIFSHSNVNNYMVLCKTDYLDDAISELTLDLEAKGFNTLSLCAIPEQHLEYYKLKYGSRIVIQEDFAANDYIYSVDKLKYLKGRKLSKKRNLNNQFDALGKWRIKIVYSANSVVRNVLDSRGCCVSHADLIEVKNFLGTYFDAQHNKDLEDEKIAVTKMIEHYDDLNFFGIILYLNDDAVAFSAGTQINDEFFDCHFELALPNLTGAYQMVNREFANCISLLFPSIKFIDREEDLGIEGLRQAKRSYQPDIISRIYSAEIKL